MFFLYSRKVHPGVEAVKHFHICWPCNRQWNLQGAFVVAYFRKLHTRSPAGRPLKWCHLSWEGLETEAIAHPHPTPPPPTLHLRALVIILISWGSSFCMSLRHLGVCFGPDFELREQLGFIFGFSLPRIWPVWVPGVGLYHQMWSIILSEPCMRVTKRGNFLLF